MASSNLVNNKGQIPCAETTCSGGGGGGGVTTINGIIGIQTSVNEEGNVYSISTNLNAGNGINISGSQPQTIANTGVLGIMPGDNIAIVETSPDSQIYQISFTGGSSGFPIAYGQFQSIVTTQPLPVPTANTAYPISHEVLVYQTTPTLFQVNNTTFQLINQGVYKITSILYNALQSGRDDVNNLWVYDLTAGAEVPNSNFSVYLETASPSFSPLVLTCIYSTPQPNTQIQLRFSTLGGNGRTYNPNISGVNANNTLINTIIERIA